MCPQDSRQLNMCLQDSQVRSDNFLYALKKKQTATLQHNSTQKNGALPGFVQPHFARF